MVEEIGQEVVEKKEVLKEDESAQPESDEGVEKYIGLLSKMLHSPQTKEGVYGMLQAGDPMQSIPSTALAINSQAEQAFVKKGGKPSLNTLSAGAQFLVNDLVEIGNAGGFFQINLEEGNVAHDLMLATMQPYIEKGLKDGSIDPVELQQIAEPLMNEMEQGEGSRMYGEGEGLPMEADERTAMETYRSQGVLGERKKSEAKMKSLENGRGNV